MPRANKSPVVGVVSYFQSAPLDAAELTLAIVKHVVAARQEARSNITNTIKGNTSYSSKVGAPRKERADKGKVRKPSVDPTLPGE